MGSNRRFCFISISRFGSFKNSFATITSMFEFQFRYRRFILLIQANEEISLSYGTSKRNWKPWNKAWPDIYDERYIFINSNLDQLTKVSTSSKCKSRDLSSDHDDCPNQHKNNRTLSNEKGHHLLSLMKRDITFWVWWNVNGNWGNMIRISQWREGNCRTDTSTRRNK